MELAANEFAGGGIGVIEELGDVVFVVVAEDVDVLVDIADFVADAVEVKKEQSVMTELKGNN